MKFHLAIPFPIKAAAALVFLPVLIPVAIVMAVVDNRRKRKVAATFRCLKCGRLLGTEALRIADAEFSKHMDELRRANPGVKYRVVRTGHAICAACGARYTFLDKERTFVLEARHDTEARGEAHAAGTRTA